MKKIGGFLSVLAIVGMFVAFISWSEKSIDQVSANATAYENCVKAEFGRSAVEVYQESGAYPDCNF